MKWVPGPLFSAQGLFTGGLCGLWRGGCLSSGPSRPWQWGLGGLGGAVCRAPLAQPLHPQDGHETALPRSCKQPRLYLRSWRGFLTLRKSGPQQFLTWGAPSPKVSGPSSMPKPPTSFAARQLHPHKVRVEKNADSRYMGICQLLSILSYFIQTAKQTTGFVIRPHS